MLSISNSQLRQLISTRPFICVKWKPTRQLRTSLTISSRARCLTIDCVSNSLLRSSLLLLFMSLAKSDYTHLERAGYDFVVVMRRFSVIVLSSSFLSLDLVLILLICHCFSDAPMFFLIFFFSFLSPLLFCSQPAALATLTYSTEPELLPCARIIWENLVNARISPNQAVYNKYASPKLGNASTVALPTNLSF